MKNTEEKPRAPYNGNIDKDNEFLKYYNKFQQYRQHRNQNVKFLNKNGVSRNILDYVRDSVERMNEYHLKPEWKDNWQSNIFSPDTRNKAIAVLSKIASARMAIDVMVRYKSIFNNADSKTRASIYKDLLDAANEHNREDEQLIWEMFTGMSEGTVFGYEGWMKDRRKAKFVKIINPDTGETETEEVVYDNWDDVYGEIVPIEQIYPQTIWCNSRDWKIKIKRVFRVRQMSEEEVTDAFGHYKNFDKVKPNGYYTDNGFLDWGIDSDIEQGKYQVIEWFDETKDEHKIWINGVSVYDDVIEFNHKRKPFWMAIFEPIHHQFLYGKSLPDKMMAMQDMTNATLNSIFDQLLLAVNSPIFISGDMDDITEGYLEPNRVYHMDTDARVERGGLSGIDQTSFQVYSLLKRAMDEISMPADQSGIPTGGRKTKYEVQILQENALNIASLFLQLMETAMKDKYLLRLYNILQYYAQPSEAMDGSVRFKFLTMENRKLTNGKVGKKMIQIVPSLGGKTQQQVKEELANIGSMEMGGQEYNPATATVEPIVIITDYLMNKDVELEIKIVPNSSVKDSNIQRKNNSIAFYQMTNGDQRYNQHMLAVDLADAFDKNPEIVNAEQTENGGLEEQVAKAINVMKGAPGTTGMEGIPAGTNIENAELEPL